MLCSIYSGSSHDAERSQLRALIGARSSGAEKVSLYIAELGLKVDQLVELFLVELHLHLIAFSGESLLHGP